MQKIDQTALNHRSVRDFKDQPLPQSTLLALEEVAQSTASSKYLQQFTLIEVTDAAKRQAVADLTHCEFVAGPGMLYVFVLDQARNIAMLPKGADRHNFTGWDGFLAGAADAQLAAQNLVGAAERSGLETVYLGSILNAPAKMIRLLHLPKYTFPLLGLMVGVPSKMPQQKPRLPHDLVVGTNGYPAADPASLQKYSNTVGQYYENRASNARKTNYIDLMAQQAKADLHVRDAIGPVLKAQGFDLPQA